MAINSWAAGSLESTPDDHSFAVYTSPSDTLLLDLAGLLAGVMNAVAGGGTFLTFPSLVFTGIPSAAANQTNNRCLSWSDCQLLAVPEYPGGTDSDGRHPWRDQPSWRGARREYPSEYPHTRI